MSSSHENIGSKWKSPISLQEQAQVEIGGGGDGYNNNTQNHHQQQQMMNPSCNTTTSDLFSMSDYEVAELTWENGHLVMHGLSGLLPSNSTKPVTWSRPNDTLESIVHQATRHKESLNIPQDHESGKDVLESPEKLSSMVRSSGGPWSETSGQVPKKQTRTDYDQYERKFRGSILEEKWGRKNVCGSASASATFCRENDTTMMTRASYESPMSFRAKTIDEDSACHDGSENRDENHKTKAKTSRSHSSRRSRATAIHNQSERRRRERINEKMKALQKLVPNANKTDKASMLDEVIDYLKQLQAQVQMMNNVMNISTTHMNTMMPLSLAMQHHQHQHHHQQQLLQMSMLLARMHGMGLAAGMAAAGMGMYSDGNNYPSTMTSEAHGSGPQSHPLIHPSMAATAATKIVNPHFMGRTLPLPPAVTNSTADLNSQQSINIDWYNKMAALYRQSINETTPSTSSPSATSKPNYD